MGDFRTKLGYFSNQHLVTLPIIYNQLPDDVAAAPVRVLLLVDVAGLCIVRKKSLQPRWHVQLELEIKQKVDFIFVSRTRPLLQNCQNVQLTVALNLYLLNKTFVRSWVRIPLTLG